MKKNTGQLFFFGLATISCCLMLLTFTRSSVQAQSLPAVRWACSSRTIYLGNPYTNPALTTYPSQPGAPKQTINLPQLRTIVAGKCDMQMVEELGTGIWLIRANIIVNQDAKLDITSATVNQLRLESIWGDTSKQFVKLVANGGQILIQGASPQQKLSIRSWDTPAGRVDSDVSDGRSYIAILNGGRMDIINAEMAYLGWNDPNPRFDSGIGKGEPSGLAWKRRASADRPETGPTGSIIDSDIHHNYYGNYTWQAINMVFRGNKVHDNGYYGFDPHDYSSNFVVENNEFYNNYKHGLIFSRGCINNIIRNNKMYNNGGHGLMLDRGSDFNLVENNEMYGNGQDGVTLYESSNNTFRNNYIHHNLRHGLRINAVYDSGDAFDALAIHNQFSGNLVSNNSRYGFSLYDRADRNSFSNNTVRDNGEYGFYIRTGLNTISGDTVSGNRRDGIFILGGPAPNYTPGIAPITPALALPGRSNRITGNTINANRNNGIFLKTETVSTTVQANTVANNNYHGVLVDGSNSKANSITRNSITNNLQAGIKLQNSGNNNMAAPNVTNATGGQISGTALANARIEVFCDSGGEGAIYKTATTANSGGSWSVAASCSAAEGAPTATATDSKNNTSAFSVGVASAQVASDVETESANEEEEDPIAAAALLVVDLAEAEDDMRVPDDDGTLSTLEGLLDAQIDGEFIATEETTAPVKVFLPVVAGGSK